MLRLIFLFHIGFSLFVSAGGIYAIAVNVFLCFESTPLYLQISSIHAKQLVQIIVARMRYAPRRMVIHATALCTQLCDQHR